MNSLAAALNSAKAFGAWPNIHTDMVPMASDALLWLQARAPDVEPPPMAAHHSPARTLLGICGWITGQWRPGVWFAFVATSEQISTNFTQAAWRCLVQACSYLDRTRHCRLAFRRARPPRGGGGGQMRPPGSYGRSPLTFLRSTRNREPRWQLHFRGQRRRQSHRKSILESQLSQKADGLLGRGRAHTTNLRHQRGRGAAPSVRGVRRPPR